MKIFTARFKKIFSLVSFFLIFACGTENSSYSGYPDQNIELKTHSISKAMPGQPFINWLGDKQGADYEISWTMWWGINGSK